MAASKEIQKRAIQETGKIGIEIQSLPWVEGLGGLEDYLISDSLLYVGPRGYIPREAQKLVDAIAGDSGFTIALVFSHDHKKVVALPLPEVYKNNQRMILEHWQSSHPVDLDEIRTSIFKTAIMTNDMKPYAWQDVVLMEKNLSNRRKEYPINVAAVKKSAVYAAPRTYGDWIVQTQNKLNGIPVSS